MNILTIKELQNKGLQPEILFWVGCAGSFDDRAKKITKSFVVYSKRPVFHLLFLERRKVVQVILQKEPVMSFYFKCRQCQILKF